MKVSIDDLLLAAEWLDHYETEPEASRCHRVAEWLRKQADARHESVLMREYSVDRRTARRAIAMLAATPEATA